MYPMIRKEHHSILFQRTDFEPGSAGHYPDPPLIGSQYGGLASISTQVIMSLVCFLFKIRTEANT